MTEQEKQEILIKQNNLIIEQNEYLIMMLKRLYDKSFGYDYSSATFKLLHLKAEQIREFVDNLLKEDVNEKKL